MKKIADSVDIEIDNVDIVEREIVEIAKKKIVEIIEKKIADIVERKIVDIVEREIIETVEIVEELVAKSKIVVEIDLIDFFHQMKFLLKRSVLMQILHSFFFLLFL